jgi:hypothetical protein
MPLDVLCQGLCGAVYFETNDKDGFNPHVTGIKSQFVRKYDPNSMANAAMIHMKDEFMGIYDDIPHDSDLFSAAIGPCPGCGHPFSNDDFKLITRPQKPEEKESEKDVLNNFFLDRCILDSDTRVTAGEIFEEFIRWIQGRDGEPISKKMFGIKLKERNFEPYRTANERGWKGIRVKNPFIKISGG